MRSLDYTITTDRTNSLAMPAQQSCNKRSCGSYRIACFLLSILALAGEAAVGDDGTPRPSGSSDTHELTSSKSWEIEGQLSPQDKWVVPAPQAGIVDKLFIKEGDNISHTQTLARWDTELVREELAIAIAAYKAAVLEADQRNERELALLTSKVKLTELDQSLQANVRFERSVSKTELQRLQLQLDQAKLTAAQADLREQMLEGKAREKFATAELLRKRIERAEVRSRMEGQVVEMFCKEGQWLAEGAPIAAIVDLKKLQFESLVHWSIASQIKPGLAISFYPATESASKKQLDEPKLKYAGIVRFVSPELNPITKQVRVIVVIENENIELLPGMTGYVSP